MTQRAGIFVWFGRLNKSLGLFQKGWPPALQNGAKLFARWRWPGAFNLRNGSREASTGQLEPVMGAWAGEGRPVVVRSRRQLAQKLSAWPQNGDTSWALCLMEVEVEAQTLAAIRRAAKVCDNVVVVRLVPGALAAEFVQVLGAAGVDVLWVPEAAPVGLSVQLAEANQATDAAALLLQAVATVLPLAVFVPRGKPAELRLARAMANQLGEMVNVEVVGELVS